VKLENASTNRFHPGDSFTVVRLSTNVFRRLAEAKVYVFSVEEVHFHCDSGLKYLSTDLWP